MILIGVTFMRRKWLLLFSIAIVGILVLAYKGITEATSIRLSDEVNIGSEQVINHTLFVASQTINIAGDVRGDVFCAGRNINISAKIDGDIICAGDSIRIHGPVSGSVRLAGRNINIDSRVDRSASLVGARIVLANKSLVGRDLSVASENIRLDGTVERDANLAAEVVTLGNQAVVGGNFSNNSPNEAKIESGAKVKGTISRSVTKRNDRVGNMNFRRFFVGEFFYWALAMLATVAVLALLASKLLEVNNVVIATHPGRTALLGFATLVVVPVLLGILFVSLVGIPLGIILLLLWLLGLVLSPILFAVFIGNRLIRGHSLLITSIIGSLIVLIAYWIPIIGFIVGIAALLLGLGSYVTIILQRASSRSAFSIRRTSVGKNKKSSTKTNKKSKNKR